MSNTINESIEQWLMNIPDYMNQRKERPLSICSEDSVSLDDLINANFTTHMNDETDLTNLALIDLDDSNEDFWKLERAYHHLVPNHLNKINYNNKVENEFYSNFENLSIYDNDVRNFVQQKRYDRSGSLSSENSSSSQSTVNSYQKYLQPSTSTYSVYNANGTTQLPRSNVFSTANGSEKNCTASFKRPSVISSKSECTNNLDRSRSQIGLSRRATHIPAPNKLSASSKTAATPTPQRTKSTVAKSTISPTPQRTKSTAAKSTISPTPQKTKSAAAKSIINPTPQHTKSTILPKKSTSNLTTSRIGQSNNKRASYIPSLPTTRSTTSLGISSIYSTKKKSTTLQNTSQPRPSTSMATSNTKYTGLRSSLRTPSHVNTTSATSTSRSPVSSKSTGLRKSTSSIFYK